MSDLLNIILDAEEGMPRPKAVSVKQGDNRVRVQITMECPADVRTVAHQLGSDVTVNEVGTGWRYRHTATEPAGLLSFERAYRIGRAKSGWRVLSEARIPKR